jgi:hypothetical protein
MARTPPENRAGIAGADCPCDAFLSELLEEQLPEQDQSSLIGHLDCCIECRTRLDELAGGHEFCLKIGRNLREDLSDVRKESPTWMALLQTRVFLADDTQAPYDDEPSLDFLAPCEKAGCWGVWGDTKSWKSWGAAAWDWS